MTSAGAHAAALSHLPGVTPALLTKLLADSAPDDAWRALATGGHRADPEHRWQVAARATDVGEVAERYRSAGVAILVRGMSGYPSMLVDDPAPPAVLFARGDLGALGARGRVAIVGTRSATHYGRQVAAGLGRELAEGGTAVLSGLARGIDGAAHAGSLAAGRGAGAVPAPPVAVVATGLDVVYPASNRVLWEEVADRGLLLTERPLGSRPDRWSFPARNRILAGLAQVVVVVESHDHGGSLITVSHAIRRGIAVGAVPGSVLSAASAGTNALLADGCFPVRDAADVEVALALATASTGPAGTGRRRPVRTANRSAPESAIEREVLAAVDDIPTTFETILVRSGLSIAEAAEACEHLVARSFLREGAGWWSKA